MSNDLIVRKGPREYIIPRGIEAQGGAAIEAYVEAWETVAFAHDRGLEVAVDLGLEPTDFAGRTGTGKGGAFKTDDVRALAAEKAGDGAGDATADADAADDEETTTDTGGDG